MNVHEAFAAYEAVRHRLPTVARKGACKQLPNLDAIAEEMDVFLLDAFGVLNIGETAIAGVPERIRGLQKAGKRVLVVSNAAGFPHANLMTKYRNLGYDFAPEDVITSRKTLLRGLQSEPKCHWGLMATESLGRADIEDLNITYLGEDPAVYDAAEAFLLIGGAAWTLDRQAMLEASLVQNPRPVYVGNPDIVAPRETGFSTEPGAFAHQLADRTGVSPRFFGKPFQNIFDLAFERLEDPDMQRIVMVGDSLHTDILGGQIAGVKTALIAGFGFFAGNDVMAPIEQSGICPDFILDRP
ncbi:TIGR01459 family HAD-type hydrolase [Sulfitobacter sp. SK012]|uniref:HAD-IIA family hydrolase n=1 Tax=Sulfitobacter sp. SK012 TaxID=1389005 RepID=UPI000E0C18C3|nr:HAD-IIA family hydrolase [Sulfitobacter sp. SK012]AXI47804.1 TIGR01459 family HAD-type hydrolase [Sulfitobacter sp. SK012]